MVGSMVNVLWHRQKLLSPEFTDGSIQIQCFGNTYHRQELSRVFLYVEERIVDGHIKRSKDSGTVFPCFKISTTNLWENIFRTNMHCWITVSWPWKAFAFLGLTSHFIAFHRGLKSLPLSQLNNVTLFECPNDDYTDIYDNTPRWSRSSVGARQSNRYASRVLSSGSHNLETLSASFLVDAMYFFEWCQPTWVWKNLRSLSLTSHFLRPGCNQHENVNHLLHVAATAALCMPKLEVMELWNHRRQWFCIFRYQFLTAYLPARMTWRANWNLCVQPNVFRAWEATAGIRASSRRFSPKIVFVKEILDVSPEVKSYRDSLDHLNLLIKIAHPASLKQIQEETVESKIGKQDAKVKMTQTTFADQAFEQTIVVSHQERLRT